MIRPRRHAIVTAAALAALFATGCSSTANTSPTSTTSSTSSPTSSSPGYPGSGTCYAGADGTTTMCVTPGRPLRRRRRRGLLLPADDCGAADADARAEYASVASFGELALRLIAVGAPVELVEACHRAALDEIRHALAVEALGGRTPQSFGAIPGLLGRRIGGLRRSRRAQLCRIAVESYLDGWRNESAAADELQHRAEQVVASAEREALLSMASDERGHADLARDIVEWCFAEEPRAVGHALGRAISPA